MKYIDWEHLKKKKDPILTSVIDACVAKNVYSLMGSSQDWNEEVVAQFYSTLWFEFDDEQPSLSKMHWSTEGVRCQMSKEQFCKWLEYPLSDLEECKIHDESVLSNDEMEHLYAPEYGTIKVGTLHGMTPFFKYLKNLFRETLIPKVGGYSDVLGISRNLLAWMAPSKKEKFSVVDFIWKEIIECATSAGRSLAYAPYIMIAVKEATKTSWTPDTKHKSYRPQLAKVQTRNLSKASASRDIPSSSSQYFSRRRNQEQSSLISRGLKAIFNVCTSHATAAYEERKFSRERMKKMNQMLREQSAKLGMEVPNSPLDEIYASPPPPEFFDPWMPSDLGAAKNVNTAAASARSQSESEEEIQEEEEEEEESEDADAAASDDESG